MIQTLKLSEWARKEYRMLAAVIMDIVDEGQVGRLERRKLLGLAEGKPLGLVKKDDYSIQFKRIQCTPDFLLCAER